MKKLFFILVTFLLVFNAETRADSPLTSTDFCMAYTNLPKFDMSTMQIYEFLSDESQPVDLRLAVINDWGWDCEGCHRFEMFSDYLSNKYDCSYEQLPEKMSGKTLICAAYLKALDDYFDVDCAIQLAECAVLKSPDSYSVNLIAALIKSQKALDQDWSMVYRLTDDVRQKASSLDMDMNPRAIEIIFEYMDIYKESM